jgi:hypothetical protein
VSTRPTTDADFPSRASHVVDTPDRYGDWREYAFSSAPEFIEGAAADAKASDAAMEEVTEAPTV